LHLSSNAKESEQQGDQFYKSLDLSLLKLSKYFAPIVNATQVAFRNSVVGARGPTTSVRDSAIS